MQSDAKKRRENKKFIYLACLWQWLEASEKLSQSYEEALGQQGVCGRLALLAADTFWNLEVDRGGLTLTHLHRVLHVDINVILLLGGTSLQRQIVAT